MAEQTFHLKIGRGEVSFSLPKEQLLYNLVGRNLAPPKDLGRAYLYALDHPRDCPPLRELVTPGKTVAITVSDITRAWQKNHLTLPLLIDYLNSAGIEDRDITVIIAVGAHRRNSDAECAELCTRQICERVRVVNNDAWDSENMVSFGTTSRGTEVSFNRLAAEADTLILTGGVIYHYMVGYGGGRKSVMPGGGITYDHPAEPYVGHGSGDRQGLQSSGGEHEDHRQPRP